MPDTWKYRKERYWTSIRIDILLASIQHHRKSWYLHHNQDESCHYLHDEYLLKCWRLYHRFELVPNEVNGRLMKHLLALQETAWLVFLLEKAMSLLTPSDKPALHLVLPDSSRSNDGNPQFRTMHIIHSSWSKSYHQNYQIWAWEWSACSEGEWYSSQALYGCHLSLSICFPHHFTRATGKVHCYSEGVLYRLFNFSSAWCYSYKGWREEDGFPWFW